VLDDALQVEPRLKKHAEAGDDLFGGWSNKTTQMNPSCIPRSDEYTFKSEVL